MVTSDQLETIKQTFPDQPVDQQYTDQPPGDASDNTQKEQDGWQWPIDGQLTVASFLASNSRETCAYIQGFISTRTQVQQCQRTHVQQRQRAQVQQRQRAHVHHCERVLCNAGPMYNSVSGHMYNSVSG